jgi:hypothetical protein
LRIQPVGATRYKLPKQKECCTDRLNPQSKADILPDADALSYKFSYRQGRGTEMQEHVAGLLDNFGDQMDKLDEVAHVLLKGHLLIEEWLTRAINQHLFHPEHLVEDGRLSFSQKVTLARSLDLRRNNLGMWDVIAAVNSLRNDLAHSLNSPKRLKKTATLKQLFFRETSGHQTVDEMKKLTDARLLRSICAACLGFLAESANNSFELRKIIHSLDRQMNSGLPEFKLQL